MLFIGGCVAFLAAVGSREPGITSNRAVDICHDTAEARLKAPGSARFPSLGQITVQTTTKDFTGRLYGQSITTPAGSRIIESYVDSHNSFGALIRTRFSCIVSPSGNILAFEFTR